MASRIKKKPTVAVGDVIVNQPIVYAAPAEGTRQHLNWLQRQVSRFGMGVVGSIGAVVSGFVGIVLLNTGEFIYSLVTPEKLALLGVAFGTVFLIWLLGYVLEKLGVTKYVLKKLGLSKFSIE